MRCQSAPEYGPYELTMYVDSGNFLLMLNVNEEDGDHSVRTPRNEKMPNHLIFTLGEKYHARAVLHDIDLAITMFNEFSNTGNVPMDLMS